MKIGLIALSGIRVHHAELAAIGVTLPGFVRRGQVIASLPSLGLLTLAGMTPAHHEVHYLEFDDLPLPQDLPAFDLVGISSLSAKIDVAYAISHHYRKQGTLTVMGGLHVSALPDEALQHCDSVVVGGGEWAWPRLLEDAESGDLKTRYFGLTQRLFSAENLVMPRFDLLAHRPYNRVTVQSSRGCPRDCEFCGASRLITSQYNQKPVERVIEEIREARKYFKHPFFELADDNTFLHRNWSREFIAAVTREEIKWFTETDVSIADDPELCKALGESGCRQVLIGMESPRADDLAGIDPQGWKRKQPDRYMAAIDLLQGCGVSVNGCFILGLDHHTPEIFPMIRDFVLKSGLAEVQLTVLTPFPGTELYARMKREGRLLKDRFWDQCTLFDVTYQPARMTVDELECGLQWLFRELYGASAEKERKRAYAVRQRQRHAGES